MSDADGKSRTHTAMAEYARQAFTILDLSPEEAFTWKELQDAVCVKPTQWQRVAEILRADPRVEIVGGRYRRRTRRTPGTRPVRIDMPAVAMQDTAPELRAAPVPDPQPQRRPRTPAREIESVQQRATVIMPAVPNPKRK